MTDVPDGIDLSALAPFFDAHVGHRPTTATLIAGGRSNLTYVVGDDDGHEWVLRRPPLGHVLPTAHDMAREYRVISALTPTNVPVPDAVAFCDDVSVIGAPFYVMQKVDGVIVREPPEFDADDARRCSEGLIDVLVDIHAVVPEAVGLGDFGRPDGYMERQVRRWGTQWESSKTRELPGVDELTRRLTRAIPMSGPATIVHGDYRLDNVMLDPDDPGRILAVLDWEMATLGDPLADLGLYLLYWAAPETAIVSAAPALVSDDYLSPDAVVARYAERSGRDVSSLDFYRVFAYFKLAIILEGINARFQMGATRGEGFETMGSMVSALVDGGLRVADASDLATLHG